MSTLISTNQAAAQIGCNPRTVQRWARTLGLGQRIGSSLVFRPGEVRQIARRVQPGPGNPDFRGQKRAGKKS